MEFTPAGRRWPSPSLSLQILGLLLGGLIVAQVVTLILTLLLPPEAPAQYDLGDIARALSGERIDPRGSRPLQRILQTEPPSITGPGWLTSERSRHELAVLLGRRDGDVQLYFYTPLPFAGTARSPSNASAAGEHGDGAARSIGGEAGRPYRLVQVGYPMSDGPPSGGSGRPAGPQGSGPQGVDPFGNGPSPQRAPAFPFASPTAGPVSPPSPTVPPTGPLTSPPAVGTGAPAGPGTEGARADVRPDGPAGGPDRTGGATTAPALPGAGIPGGLAGDGRAPRSSVARRAAAAPVSAASDDTPAQASPHGAVPGTVDARSGTTSHAATVVDTPAARASAPATVGTRSAPPDASSDRGGATTARAAPLVAGATRRGLFGLAPAPFVEGDFIATLRTTDGWTVVQPVPESFPNAWQRRVLLWFVVAFASIAPLGWLFARRVVRPLVGFAAAAERLGRDPTAQVPLLAGPAEVGRAAVAFNRMQSRLRSFVDDRTAMIGAISHDLRTPLTRLRFRLEDVDDDLREGMLADLDEMEQMIASVLAFIRDASEPGSREKLDLSSIVEEVVEDAVFVGSDVRLTLNERAPVEVDAIGMRRLLANLVENAVKYGDHARVRLFTDRSEAVTEVSDDGPGLSDDDLERVFEPFYRAPTARASGKQGSGLGLAVCRSIARAHGGDVHLMRGERGLVAQVRVPLAYGA